MLRADGITMAALQTRFGARRFSSVAAVLGLIAGLCALIVVPQAQGAGALNLVKNAPARVLYGSSATVTLTATNPGTSPVYNASFRDVLPAGVTLASATPAPTSVIENQPLLGQTTLVWVNVNDAQPSASASVTYSVTHTTGTDAPGNPLHAGDTYTSTAQVFGNTDPRYVPDFSPIGIALPGVDSYDTSGSAAASTQIVPIRIQKAEPSPEGELLRGVHDHTTVYTLTVTNNAIAATNTVVVDDYLPAQLEFLQCGGIDNTPAGLARPEYAGAALLTATPPVTTNCPAPTLVETVVDPVGLPPGVYTHVRWTVGSMAAGAVTSIRYAAGIPLRANAAFPANPVPPTPGSLGQAANLENNTGQLTTESSEQQLTNSASVTGVYSGYGGAVAADTSTITRSSEDLAIQKRVTAGGDDVNNGETVGWAMTLSTGEYRSASNVVVVDSLPDGYEYVAGSATLRRVSPSPEGPASVAPSISLLSNGVQVLTWNFNSAPGTLGTGFVSNAVYELTFESQTLPNYRSTGQPVAANDGLVNNVSVSGDTTPTFEVASIDTGTQAVGDVSSSGQSSSWQTIAKSVAWPLTGTPVGLSCDSPSNLASIGSPQWLPRFAPGDTVCYRLQITFPTDTRTRNTIVTDFLPPNSEYMGSATGGLNTVTIAGAPTVSAGYGGSAAWAVGELITGARYTERGSRFDMFVATQVTDVPQLLGDPQMLSNFDLNENLLKAVSTNTIGEAVSLRADADFMTITPTVDLTTGVKSINGVSPVSTPDDGNGAPTGRHDGKIIRAEDTVTFRVDVTNTAPTDAGLSGDASSLQLVNIMPVGLDCSTVSLGLAPRPLTLAANNANPFTAQVPPRVIGGLVSALSAASCTDRPGLGSVLRWTVTNLPAGFSAEINYDVSIPTGGSAPTAGEILDTSAGVLSYLAPRSNEGGFVTYIPTSNVDPVSPGTANVPAANDQSRIQVEGTINSKTAVTALVETNNDEATHFTPGEAVTYTIRWTIPEGVSLRSPVTITDVLPTNIAYIPGTLNVGYGTNGTASPVAGCANVDACGPFTGDALDFTVTTGTTIAMSSTTGTYVNPVEAGAGEDVFTISFTGRLTSGNRNDTVTNTATYSWRTTAGVTQSFTTDVANTVVRPNAAITKSHSPAGPFQGGDAVTYTLSVTNVGSNASPLHDVTVTDCVPAGLVPTPGTPTTTGASPSPAVLGTIGAPSSCAGAGTLITWLLPSTYQLNRNVTLGLTYGVTVVGTGGTLGAAANTTNTATLIGDNFPLTPATISGVPIGQVGTNRTTTDNIPMRTVVIDKTVAQATRVAGQPADYTATATIPAGLRVYDAVLVDTLPTNLVYITGTASTVTTGTGCVALGGTSSHTLPPTSTQVAWWVGDIEAAPATPCVLTVTYQATPAPAAISGASLVNSAQLVWRDTNTDTNLTAVPVTSGYPRSVADTALLSTVKPAVNVVKSADKTAVEAGDTVAYDIVVTNTGTAAAFDIQIHDTLPPGFAAPTAITNGGVFTAAVGLTPAAIDWTLFAGTTGLLPAESVTLTYSRKVSSAVALGAAGNLTNIADITAYFADQDHATGLFESFNGNADDATVTSRVPILAINHTVMDGSDLKQSEIDQPFTWVVSVTNTGTGPAYGVDITDALPANWEFIDTTSITNNGVSVAIPSPATSGTIGAGQSISWANIGTLQPGEAITLRFTAKPLVAALPIPFSAGTLYTSTATAGGSDFGGDALNEPSDPAQATIRVADLNLDKRDASATFVIGSVGHYYLDVSNLGPDTAAGPITVTDTLPSGLVLAGTPTTLGTGLNWACTGNAGETTLSCTLLSIPVGGVAAGAAIRTIDVPVNVLESALPGGASSGSVSNSASVAGATYEVVNSNNSDTEPTPIARISDVSIAKTRTGGTMLAGQDQTYSITVTHNGPSPLTGTITVTDPLPVGLRLMAVPSGAGWNCTTSAVGTGYTTTTNGEVVCTRIEALLAANTALGTISVLAKIDPAATAPASIVNSAAVSSPNDSNASNDTANANTTPTAQADITIDKSDAGAVFKVGDANTYQVAVTNAGPSNEVGAVVVTDPIPVGMRLTGVAGNGAPSAWDCSTSTLGTGTTAGTTGSVRCVHTPGGDPFGPGESLDPILITVDVGANAAPNPDPAFTNRVTNTATVTAVTDTTPSNDSTLTEIERIAGLTIDKTHADGPVWSVGSTHSYSLAVLNNGPSPEAGPVSVSDTLPTGMRFVSAAGTGWACSHTGGTPLGGGGTVGCTLPRSGGIAIGGASPAEVITITVDVLPSAAPLLAPATNTAVNNATVVGVTDPVLKSDSDPVTVDPVADLALDKSHVGQFVVGETGRFEFVITNVGSSTAAAPVTVTDTLPAGLTFNSSTGTGWTCAAVGQLVTCTTPTDLVSLGSLPVLGLVVDVGPLAELGVTNTATADTPTTDPVAQNDTDTDTVTATPSSDLQIVKSHSAAEFYVGLTATWTLQVTNIGPSTNVGPIVVTDVIPAGMSITPGTSGAQPGWDCGASTSSVLNCVRSSPLAAGALADPIVLTASVSPAAVPIGDPNALIPNTATVTSPTLDRVTTNNTSTDPTLIVAAADLSIDKVATAPLVSIGEDAEFLIRVTNNGPAPAVGVVVTDIVPADLWIGGASGTGWLCETVRETGSVTCQLPSRLEIGATTEPITITAVVSRTGHFINSASVTSVLSDLVPGNNTDTADVDGIFFPVPGIEQPVYPTLPPDVDQVRPIATAPPSTSPSTVPLASVPDVSPSSEPPGGAPTSTGQSTTIAGTPITQATAPASTGVQPGSGSTALTTVTPTADPTGQKAVLADQADLVDGQAEPGDASQVSQLSLTGNDVMQSLLAAFALVVCGMALLIAGRRKRARN